jgi:transcriptional regulator with XRE-family HTH domain
MKDNWAQVAQALSTRLEALGMTQTDLANRSKVSLTTVRELVQNLNARRRQPRTLEAVSEAVGWPSDRVHQILRGEPLTTAAEIDTAVLDDELLAMREQLNQLNDRLDAIDRTEAAMAEVQSLLEQITARLDRIEIRKPESDKSA